MNKKLPHYLFIFGLAASLFVFPAVAWGQAGRTVTGTVTDESGTPLAGVDVTVEGRNVRSVTDGKGNFRLDASRGESLVFSLMGMISQKVILANQTHLDVSMIADVIDLDGVVVVGYGTQRKRDLTTAISTVSPDQMKDMPIVDINQALIGQAAGVNVTEASGSPGGGFDIQIRGMSTLGADSNPLYVVDGVILQMDANLESGPFSFINPGDVESIEILKDAAAAAIYGSRASNGVVLITTKSGKLGKAKVNVMAKHGVQQLFRKVDLLSAQEFAELAIEARNNFMLDNIPNADPSWPDALRAGNVNYQVDYFREFLESGAQGTDWQDAIFRNTHFQEYQVNVSGGTNEVKYLFSGGMLDQDGIVKNTGFQRYSFRSNVDATLGKRVSVGVKLNPVFSKQDFIRTHGRYHDARAGVVQGALLMNPLAEIYDPESISGYTMGINQGHALVNVENPVAKVDLLKDERINFRFIGDTFINIKLAKGLDFRVSGSINAHSYQRLSILPSTIGGYTNRPPRDNNIESNESQTYNLQSAAQLTYNAKFKGGHNLTAIGVYETQFQQYTGVSATAQGTWTDDLMIVSSSLDESYRMGSSSRNEWGLVSWISRANYDFRNKYYLMASVRADGSSRFAKKWGIFPAASAAWRVSQEGFLKNSRWISDLKLRASYGVTGNNSIGSNQYMAMMTGSNYVFGAGGESIASGVRLSSFGNDQLTWEKTYQIDAGIDVAFLRNRISITADVYDKQTHDMLLSLQMPLTMGQSSMMTNIGRIENRGVEFTIDTRNFVRRFKWNTNFNISFNRQKVLELGPEGDPLYSNALFFENASYTQIGNPVGLFYGLNVVGIYQNQEEVDNYPGIKVGNGMSRPGEFMFEDVNKDGSITLDDRTILGDPHPDFSFGFTNTFSYQNFTLKVFLRGVIGFDVMNMSFGDTMYNMGANAPRSVLNRWQSEEEPGDGKTPRVVRANRAVLDNSILNSSFIEDGSFVNIQNISLSYSIPRHILNRARIEGLSATFAVHNVYMFTQYTGYNPEGALNIGSTLSPGVDWGTYPLSRTYSLTLTATF